MSRINTNVVSMLAQRNLATSNANLNKSLERLSTGLKINRGSDDPAGLIASERLRSEKVALTSAISNSTRATNLLGTAEGSLNEISSQLLDIQGLLDTASSSGGMTTEETAANQMQIDEALTSISRIASTTQFNGKKLLDGTLGFRTQNVNALITSVIANQAVFQGATKQVSVTFDSSTAAKGTSAMLAADILLANGTVRIEGNKGAANVNFTTGMNQAAVISAVNAVEAQTGVHAAVNAANIDYTSSEYGSHQFVRFTRLGTAAFTVSADEDYGANTAVTALDGSTTGVSVEGLKITVKRTGLDLELAVSAGQASAARTFDILQGGAKFQIGAEVNSNNQVSVGIRNVDSDSLGDAVTGFLSTLKTGGFSGTNNDLASGNFATAATIVTTAISQVSNLRGRLGALQKNTLESQIRSLGTTLENITTAESNIRDTDFAAETAAMTRAQILGQAGTSVLAMANSAPQNVLSLLRQ